MPGPTGFARSIPRKISMWKCNLYFQPYENSLKGGTSQEQMPLVSVFNQMVHICEKSLSIYQQFLDKYEYPMLQIINIHIVYNNRPLNA